VRDVQPLDGGTSSAVHALSVECVGGPAHSLVLRRFVRLDWLAEEPDLAEREAAALGLLTGTRLATPELVAVDQQGLRADVPAVLMTRLSGQIEWDPPALDPFLRGLAEALPIIHATRIPAGVLVPAYQPYKLEMHRPPVWAARADVWLRAIEVLETPRRPTERSFIHRDYHPGNVLWRRDEVSGIVDWVNASVGSPWADVGHCRVNLADRFGQAASDRFLHLYRAASGRSDEYHPYWDIAAAIGGLDESCDAQPSLSDEEFLAAAVSRL